MKNREDSAISAIQHITFRKHNVGYIDVFNGLREKKQLVPI
jgi:hypothetical protein